MESKKVRNIKVISQSGRNYKPTPTVILKGQWLNEMGFEIGDQIKVECEQGKLVISLDRERMELLDAERAFMETEIKKLQVQFQILRKTAGHGSTARFIRRFMICSGLSNIIRLTTRGLHFWKEGWPENIYSRYAR